MNLQTQKKFHCNYKRLFRFQGQKCSAPSRIYLPKSLWPSIKKELLDEIKTIKIGEPDTFLIL
ncbi:MAG: hypothetical protein Ct9H90mP3_4790 [Flammeovirgaceae bacterium]|nr:MAG: hypothetical protein Ct9H90mP3_4790 [Flammeovirgaceae bacterium]